MTVNSTISNKISFYALVRTVFLLFISLQISFGHISQYLDCFEMNEIELAEERDVESEEKENNKEIEKDEFLNRMFFFAFSDQQKLHLLDVLNSNWNPSQDEVPTPPPRIATFC